MNSATSKPNSINNNLSTPPTITLTLGKRKYEDAFAQTTYDDVRFGQHIESDFFTGNIGHGIYQPEVPPPSKCQEAASTINKFIGPTKIQQFGLSNAIDRMAYWCEKYKK